jgi:hypothetical protein
MYEGKMIWIDNFEEDDYEEELFPNTFIMIDPNPRALIHTMLFYLGPNDTLISFEIRQESDANREGVGDIVHHEENGL